MQVLTDRLQRGIAGDLAAPTWMWDIAEPKQPAMAYRDIRHRSKARRLYHDGWSWRQVGVEGLSIYEGWAGVGAVCSEP